MKNEAFYKSVKRRAWLLHGFLQKCKSKAKVGRKVYKSGIQVYS